MKTCAKKEFFPLAENISVNKGLFYNFQFTQPKYQFVQNIICSCIFNELVAIVSNSNISKSKKDKRVRKNLT